MLNKLGSKLENIKSAGEGSGVNMEDAKALVGEAVQNVKAAEAGERKAEAINQAKNIGTKLMSR